MDFTIKVVTTMITKRPCIPVAQINDLSGMTDRHSYAHTSKIFIMVATKFQEENPVSHTW